MSKVALIAIYDEQALDIRCLSNALADAGHQVVVIHFKIGMIKSFPYFMEHTDCYQVAYAKEGNPAIAVNVWGCDVNPWTVGETRLLQDFLCEIKPDIVGLSTRCVYSARIHEVINAMKECGAVTIAGGHDASFRPEFYKDLGIDYICIGDGENAIIALANGVHHLPGTAFNFYGNGFSVYHCETDHFHNPDNQAQHFLIESSRAIPIDQYSKELEQVNYYTFLGKGCTGQCTFCSAGAYNRLHTPFKTRCLRDIDAVIDECVFAEKELGLKQIFFLDSFLVGPSKHLLEFFDKYKKRVSIPFFAQLSPEQVCNKPEVLDGAVDAGLFQTVAGFQSGSEKINREVFNRKTSNKTLLKFAQMCVNKGVEVHYHFITHNPYETVQTAIDTFHLIGTLPYSTGCAAVFRPLNVFPNTRIYDMVRADGLNLSDKFEENCKWLTLYMLKFKRPELRYSDCANATLEEIKAAYRGISWNLR